MDCVDIREKLAGYLDGELPREEKGLVEEHLGACLECTQSLSELQKTVEHVRSLEEVEPPPWLTKKVMEEIRSGEEKPRRFLRKLFYPLYIKLPIETAALVLIAVFAVYVFKAMPPEMRTAKTPSEETAPQGVSKEKTVPQGKTTYQPTPKSGEQTGKEVVSEEGGLRSVAPPSPHLGGHLVEKEREARFEGAQTPPSKGQETRDSFFTARQAPSPAGKQEQAVPSTGIAARNEAEHGRPSVVPQTKALAEKKGEIISLTVKVEDIKTADKEIEKIITSLGGRVTKRESLKDKDVFMTEIASRKSGELISALRRIGEVQEKGAVSGDSEGVIQVRIEVIKMLGKR